MELIRRKCDVISNLIYVSECGTIPLKRKWKPRQKKCCSIEKVLRKPHLDHMSNEEIYMKTKAKVTFPWDTKLVINSSTDIAERVCG